MDRNTGRCTRNVCKYYRSTPLVRALPDWKALEPGNISILRTKVSARSVLNKLELCAGSGILLQRRRRHERYYRNRCGANGEPFGVAKVFGPKPQFIR